MATSGHGGREVRGKAPAREGLSHHEGFNEALEDALQNIGLAPGTYHARIQFEAEVTVTNPGGVGVYHAVLTTL